MQYIQKKLYCNTVYTLYIFFRIYLNNIFIYLLYSIYSKYVLSTHTRVYIWKIAYCELKYYIFGVRANKIHSVSITRNILKENFTLLSFKTLACDVFKEIYTLCAIMCMNTLYRRVNGIGIAVSVWEQCHAACLNMFL